MAEIDFASILSMMNEHSVLRNNCLDEKGAHINRGVQMVTPQILVKLISWEAGICVGVSECCIKPSVQKKPFSSPKAWHCLKSVNTYRQNSITAQHGTIS